MLLRAPIRPYLLTLLAFACACGSATERSDPAHSSHARASSQQALEYPRAAHGDVVDEYHGVAVADPHRWLEDSDSGETREWIEAENELTEGWLSEIPERGIVLEKLERLWTYERYGSPSKHGDQYFFSYNDGKMNQSVLMRAASLTAEPEVILDPNRFSDDGTVSLGGASWSEDGRFLAYGLSDGGSDWRTWHVRDLSTGKDLDDELNWVKFTSPSWTHDGAGFFYGRYPETEDELQAATLNQKLYYHRVGEPQSEDALVFEDPEHPQRGFGPFVTEGGRFLGLFVWEGSARKNRLYVKDLEDADSEFVHTFDDFDASYQPIGNQGWTFWLQTNKDAPKGRVVAVDASKPNPTLREIIPEQDDTLQGVSFVGDRLVATYLSDAKTRVRVFKLDGEAAGDVELPGLGTARGFGGRQDDPETFYSFGTYTRPTEIYRYDVRSGESTLFKRSDVPFDAEPYVTEQVFFRSKDGTRVPMFITRRKDARLDGTSPTLLYGYGGFNVSLQPSYSNTVACWLEMGGIYAVPNLRGGGEYGRAWHEAGTRAQKQNVFDDFIAAGEWLVEEGYTSRDRLAIFGGSNGGLLVGACMTQRPDLFAAALPAVGVLDMLRYHKFTVGWAWEPDYGTSDDPEMFPVLKAYSPLHNLKSGTSYPATFITTGDHDDRVVPGHSFKFAAALQEAQGGADPVLIRIETRAGHGAGKSKSQQIEEAADRWTFLVRTLGMQLTDA